MVCGQISRLPRNMERFLFDQKVNLKLELHFLLFTCGPLIHIYRITSICMRLHVYINNKWLILDQEIFFIDTIYNSLISICLSKIHRKRNFRTKNCKCLFIGPPQQRSKEGYFPRKLQLATSQTSLGYRHDYLLVCCQVS